MNVLKLSSVSMGVLMAACTMAPTYVQPELPVAASWQADVYENWSGMPWQQFYYDETLQTLIQTALENNRDLRVAVLNVEAARGLYGIQRADLVPTVTADGSLTAQHTPRNASSTGQGVTSRSYSANLATTAYEVDLFGRVRSLNKAALEEWLATEEARKTVKLALISEVANAYLQWVADTEVLHLTEETLTAQKKSQKLIQASFDSGVSSKLDVAQVTQAVASAKASLYQAKRQVAQDENALLLLLGTEKLPALMETSLLEKKLTDVFAELPENLPSAVLLNRPDVQQAEHTLQSMNANIGAARANFFPTISLTGRFGFASNGLDTLFEGGSAGAWALIPSVSIPVFEGGRNLAHLRYSQAQKDIAVANYEKSVQTAFKEVADELAAKATLSGQMAAQQELVDAAQSAYDLSYSRYLQGVDRFLNTLDAQRTLYAAQIGMITLRQQNMANHIALYKALGGGAMRDVPAVE